MFQEAVLYFGGPQQGLDAAAQLQICAASLPEIRLALFRLSFFQRSQQDVAFVHEVTAARGRLDERRRLSIYLSIYQCDF